MVYMFVLACQNDQKRIVNTHKEDWAVLLVNSMFRISSSLLLFGVLTDMIEVGSSIFCIEMIVVKCETVNCIWRP